MKKSAPLPQDQPLRKETVTRQAMLSQAVEQAGDIIFIANREGVIEYVNPAFETVTGYAKEEALGKTPRLLQSGMMPVDYYRRLWNTILAGETFRAEVIDRKKNGELFHYDQTVSPLKDSQGRITHFISTGKDATERKRAEQEIRLLLELTQIIAEAENFDSALSVSLRTVCENTGWDYGEAWALSADGKRLEPGAPYFCKAAGLESFRGKSQAFTFEPGIGLPGRAWASGKAAWIPDVTLDANFPRAAIAGESGLKAAVGIPILDGDAVVAVIAFFMREARREDERMVALISAVAAQLGTAFQRKRAQDEIAKLHADLKRSSNIVKKRLQESETLARIARALNETERVGLQTVLQLIAVSAKELIPAAEQVVIHLWDEEQQVLISQAAIGFDAAASGKLKMRPNEGVAGLYLQPNPARPVTSEDRAMVSSIAKQIAQQVENIRLLADASRARAEAEEATRRLTRESWEAYAAQKRPENIGFVYDLNDVVPLGEAPLLKNTDLTLPLTVRGETIGQLAVSGGKEISAEKAELTAAVAERVSVHLETLRLAEELQKRAAELQTVARLSTTASTMLNPDELLQSVVDLAKERFDLYYADIYLANEAWQTLLLAAGSDEIGRRMVEERHAIPMNAEKSIIARAARDRQVVIANDVENDPSYLRHPLLPATRSEISIPMIVGDQLLGIFDAQSQQVNRFTAEDASIYTTLAAQVAVSLQNARLYMEQSATLAQLRELDRLKSSFLANMSHELRTPLNSILGFADVMLEGLDGPLTKNMNNDLGLIQKNGQHLLHLINDVLDMAKIEAGRMNLNPERFHIHDLLQDVTSITSTLASEKNLSLFIETDSDSAVEIFADRTRIRQVMINLVNNAIKFTEKGQVRLRADRRGNLITVSVRDTGVGIPPDNLEDIFQEFTQVDTSTTRRAGGTGLGLPISRKLIEMHGGRLWAESAGVDGEGAAFFVELPIEAVITEPVEIEKAQK